MNTTRSHDEGAQEPPPYSRGEQAAPAYSNPVVGGQLDTARGEPRPHTQVPPSRLITLPLEHVKILLSLVLNNYVCISDVEKAIIRETYIRMADAEGVEDGNVPV